jgi:hypothetical protein
MKPDIDPAVVWRLHEQEKSGPIAIAVRRGIGRISGYCLPGKAAA